MMYSTSYYSVDLCSLFVHKSVFARWRTHMSAGLPELLLLSVGAAGGCVAALFAILAFVRTRQPAGILTKESATHVLRSETDIVRAAIHDQARWLRQELGASLTS